jgi:small-conductance mechanosensitive channel
MLKFKIIETIALILLIAVLRTIFRKIVRKIHKTNNYSELRIIPIFKLINVVFIFILFVGLLGIWGINQNQVLAFLTSVLAVLGVAFFAQWSILSNITSAIIIFTNHSIKIGDPIKVLDKDFNIEGTVFDIGLMYLTILTSENEKILVPNNVFIQKMTKTDFN